MKSKTFILKNAEFKVDLKSNIQIPGIYGGLKLSKSILNRLLMKLLIILVKLGPLTKMRSH